MEYLVDGKKFHFSYQELREHYIQFISMTDSEFINKIDEALHFAIFVCYLKEIPTYLCLSDMGIVHELLHLGMYNNVQNLQEIRELFKNQLSL